MSVFAQGTNSFADVKESDWYYDYISYALDNDIIAGKGTDQNGLIIADRAAI